MLKTGSSTEKQLVGLSSGGPNKSHKSSTNLVSCSDQGCNRTGERNIAVVHPPQAAMMLPSRPRQEE